MTPLDYSLLARALKPEIALVIGALVVLGWDLALGRRHSLQRRLHTALVIAGVAVIAALAAVVQTGARGAVYAGVLNLDALGVATRGGVLGLALLTLGVTAGAKAPRHPAEYVAILLFATAGFTLMAVSHHLLVAFVALELASLSLYILAGFDKERPESAEAALKYFLFGGMATAFLLFGFSLIYGATGELNLAAIRIAQGDQAMTPLLAVALVMVLVSFGFKAAAAPFHLWAPDAYEGAPTPSAALIASASKLAGFAFFLRLLWPGLGPLAQDDWTLVVAVLAGASLLLGNLAALAQTNLRRLLAYSAIAHAGAMLLGVIAAPSSGPAALFYYVATYGVATAGAFGVVAVLERNGVGGRLDDLAGLHRRSPLLAGCLTLFILSLAGIPPLAGFFGKFAVFAAALRLDGLSSAAGWLTVLAILLSAVGLYYYLLVLKQALVAGPAPGAERIRVAPTATVTLLAAAALTVLLGLFPSLVLGIF